MKIYRNNKNMVKGIFLTVCFIMLFLFPQPLHAQIMEEVTDFNEDMVTSKQDSFVNMVLFVDFSDTVTHNHGTSDSFCFKKEGNADKTFLLLDGTDASGTEIDKRALKPYLYNISYGEFSVENVYPQYDSTTKTIHSYVLSNTASYYAANPSMLLSELMDKLNHDADAKNRIGSMNLSHREAGVLDNVMIIVGCAGDGMGDPFGGVTYKSGGASFTNSAGTTYSVGSFNIITESGSYLGVDGSGLPIHEFMHSIGYPDLYCNVLVGGARPIPVGIWDIMSSESAQVQYPLAYMRQYISGWLDLPVVTTSQTGYTLTAETAANPNSKNRQAVILKTPYSDSEYFIVEYRKRNSMYTSQGGISYDYDTKIPGSGLIIYRVNKNLRSNIGGAPFLVYVYRPDDKVTSDGYEEADSDTLYMSDSYLSADSGRTSYGASDMSAGLQDNAITYSDGTNSGIVIKNVGNAGGDTISFDISFSRTEGTNYWTTITTGRDNENSRAVSSYMDTDGILYCLQTSNSIVGGDTAFYKVENGMWTKLADAPSCSSVTPAALTKYNGNFYMAYQDGAGYLVLAQYSGGRFTPVFTSDITVTEYDMAGDEQGITLVYNGEGYNGMYSCTYREGTLKKTIVSAGNGTWMANPKVTVAGGKPYVIYRNGSAGNTLVVKGYTDSGWKEIPLSFSSDLYTLKGDGNYLYLLLKNAGVLELYRMDTGNVSSGFIKQGNTGITDETVDNMNICISDGIPYVVYGNANYTRSASIKSGSWQTIGNTIVSTTIDNLSLYSCKGYLYAVYRKTENFSTNVKRYKVGDGSGEPSNPQNPPTPPEPEKPIAPANPSILSGVAHVQSYGDRTGSFDGTTLSLGTTGQGKRLESVTLHFENNTGYSGELRYRVHRQTYGWTNWVTTGQPAGTVGQSKRLEALQLELTGELAKHYSIRYRVHIQSYGWNQGWQYDGALAGTTGEAKRLEALEIQLVPREEPMDITYRVHCQTYGWEKNWSTGGNISGTTGQSKRLEGITIALTGNQYSGGITYSTHVQSYGWMSDVSDGWMSGTSGEAKRLEAIRIRLTGQVSQYYDVYYRVHAQSYGWLGWAKNGASAGTAGQAKRLEAIQIVLVPKGGTAPGINYKGVTSVSAVAYVEKF